MLQLLLLLQLIPMPGLQIGLTSVPTTATTAAAATTARVHPFPLYHVPGGLAALLAHYHLKHATVARAANMPCEGNSRTTVLPTASFLACSPAGSNPLQAALAACHKP